MWLGSHRRVLGNACPVLSGDSGMDFPVEHQPESASHFERRFRDAVSRGASTGKCVPFLDQILGYAFRMPAQMLNISSHL